ncbi:MAG: hypothetical protein UY50_C0023G0020 [Parcubacteria group bacterium GW2011_GWA2_49_9]|nr:MAG: hypothetical protein UY50_C0023G0020 [Parcubacteria group bacterium GW2011_GWA2_49_9]
MKNANAANNDGVVYPELSYKINGLCFKVHNDLGRFRTEQSYADAFEEGLKKANLSYTREVRLPPSFVGEKAWRNVPDFVIEGIIVVDLKAKHHVTREDYYQMQRYLSVLNLKLGLIVNFQQQNLYPKRVLNSRVS